jgi:hypothetical protein
MFSAAGENHSLAARHFQTVYPKIAIIGYAILKPWNAFLERISEITYSRAKGDAREIDFDDLVTIYNSRLV